MPHLVAKARPAGRAIDAHQSVGPRHARLGPKFVPGRAHLEQLARRLALGDFDCVLNVVVPLVRVGDTGEPGAATGKVFQIHAAEMPGIDEIDAVPGRLDGPAAPGKEVSVADLRHLSRHADFRGLGAALARRGHRVA